MTEFIEPTPRAGDIPLDVELQFLPPFPSGLAREWRHRPLEGREGERSQEYTLEMHTTYILCIHLISTLYLQYPLYALSLSLSLPFAPTVLFLSLKMLSITSFVHANILNMLFKKLFIHHYGVDTPALATHARPYAGCR